MEFEEAFALFEADMTFYRTETSLVDAMRVVFRAATMDMEASLRRYLDGDKRGRTEDIILEALRATFQQGYVAGRQHEAGQKAARKS